MPEMLSNDIVLQTLLLSVDAKHLKLSLHAVDALHRMFVVSMVKDVCFVDIAVINRAMCYQHWKHCVSSSVQSLHL